MSIKDIIRDCFDNSLANQNVEEFMSEFDEELLEKFIDLYSTDSDKNSMILLDKKAKTDRDNAYSVEFDCNTNKLVLTMKSKSFDKIVQTKKTLQFSMPEYYSQFLNKNTEFYMYDAPEDFLPSLVFGTEVKGIEDNIFPSQNHQKAIAELETSKKKQFLTFEYTPYNELVIGQKFIGQGKVSAFDVKRLNNKDFTYVVQQNFFFNQDANYPVQKTQRKRFQISHKDVRQAWIAEDINSLSLDYGLECLEHSYKGSPYLSKIYYDGKARGHDFYLAKLPRNPFEIRTTFNDDKIVEIDYEKAMNAQDNAIIAHKIYTRNLKKKDHQK